MNVWKSWAETAKELDESCLSRFYAEIRKSDGSDYELGSLRVMLTAIDRHLKQNDSKISIAKDREFVKCRQALEGKARALRVKGHAKQKHLPSKMKSSYGKIVYLGNKIQIFPVCPFNTTVQRRQSPKQ